MKKKNIMCCWIGFHDLKASRGEIDTDGPIGQAARKEHYDEIHLLYNYKAEDCLTYSRWLQNITTANITLHPAELRSPTDYQQIYSHADKLITECLAGREKLVDLTLHLSPGTPAMAAIWIILGKVNVRALTGETAGLIHSSTQKGVEKADVPFDFLVFKHALKRLIELDLPDDFIAEDKATLKAVKKLRKVAPWDTVTVLITGKTGTGKERFAKQIHAWTWEHEEKKKARPFVAFNCAALPDNLIESELFGLSVKAGVGLSTDREGKFEAAHGGTLFMDEIGELSLAAQAKVLRAIQEKKITMVGETDERKVSVRIVAATHRDLLDEVKMGRFREDLYYRLAEAEIQIPPLQERRDDILPLAAAQLKELNRTGEEKNIPNYQAKQFSPDAEQLLLEHDWPGNVRELQLVVKQAAIWTNGDTIRKKDLLHYVKKNIAVNQLGNHPLLPPLKEVTSIETVLEKIKKDYLIKAYKQTGTQEQAAKLLGLSGRGSVKEYLSRKALHGIKKTP